MTKDTNFKYELFFELSPDLLCIAGYDGYFKKVNSAVARTLGYSFEELYARPINDFVHPDHKDLTNKVRNELFQSKALHLFENKYLTKGGEIVWLSWTSLPVEDERLIFAIAKNVTHKKRVEADRNALLANLTRTNKDLMQLNYATSEDLKSPVHSLLALFDLIDLSKVTDKETLQLLEVMQYVGEKVKKTLNSHVDMLSQKTKQDAHLEQTDFQHCLDQVLQSLATIIQTSKTTVRADFSELPTIVFNKAYLTSIFLNLITNAIKYARPDRLPVISIRSATYLGTKQLTVADNGSGFDTEKVRKDIYQLPEKFHNNPESRGIGLYLVNSHVSALGGQMDIESKINEGTKITIYFKG
jgi:PAS domain S-box-containing protein